MRSGKIRSKNSKSKSIVKFSIVVLIIAICAYIATCGLTLGRYEITNVMDEETGIKKGMDLAGGAMILFEADTDKEVSAAELDSAQAVIRTRLDSQGYYDAVATKQGDRRIRVEIPAVMDTQSAVDLLGSTAKLQFRDKDGTVVIEGKDVADAQAVYGQMNDQGAQGYYVALKLTGEGKNAFAEATDRIRTYSAGENYIAIYLDEEQVSAPQVSERIDSTDCQITGNFDADTANKLASQIKSGNLPFALKVVESRTIGAQLGEEALDKSILAGFIGLILVMIFMIALYRVCGVVASISLVAYITIVAGILGMFSLTLTLPGIAGIILTIGTAVDANVIIFERIKDELKLGKTLRASVDSGFKRAFTAIIDANITTLIAAVVLYYFGTGSIKGFAVTLFIGTVVSMFTAIIVTKFLLRQVITFGSKNPKLYSA